MSKFNPEKIWRSTTLPTLPAVAVKLLDMSRDPDTEIGMIAEVIKTDPAICAKILQSTNSTYFGFSSQIKSIEKAVPLLGTTVVTSLALSFSLASDSINTGAMQDYYTAYWKQSIVHAVAAEEIGKRCTKGLECEYFLAGLMMDIGRLAMLKSVSREYFPVVIACDNEERPLFQVEREYLSIDHAQVAEKLMENWGLPTALMDGLKWQHADLETIKAELQPGEHNLEAAMALANAVGDYFMTPNCGLAFQRIECIAEHFFGIDKSQIEAFTADVHKRADQAGELFNVDMSDLEDPGDLMAQASQQLLAITMRAHHETEQVTARQKVIEAEKEQLQSQNTELQEKVTRDALTGVFNRAYFDESLDKAITEGQDRCTPVAVIFTDIDKFKLLNDNYGHQFGDEVLKKFTRVLSKNLRSVDILARYGGEEFVILVTRPTEKGVEKLAERLRSMVEAELFEFEGQRVPVTASFGTAIVIPGRCAEGESTNLLKQADAAMYDSKKNGRNQVTLRCLITEPEREFLKAINQAKFSRWLVNQEILDIPAVSRALLQVVPDPRSVGELAVGLKLLTREQIELLVTQQKKEQPQKRFGELAIEAGYLTEVQLINLLSWQTEPPVKLTASLAAKGVFSSARCQQLFLEYRKQSPLSRQLTTV